MNSCNKLECIYQPDYPTVNCADCGLSFRNFTPIPIQTNYDKELAEMTIEKMAEERIKESCGCWYDNRGKLYGAYDVAIAAEIAWLNQPAGEE